MTLEYIWVVFLGIPFLILVFQKPKILTNLVLLFSFYQLGWFVRYHHAPIVFSWISLLLGGILGIKLLFDMTAGRLRLLRRHKYLRNYFCLTFILFSLTILSDVYNGESLVHGIFQLRYYTHGFIIGLGLFYYQGKTLSVDSFKRALLLLGLWQIPFSIVKYLLAGGGLSKTLDSVTGSFSSYGELVACQMLAIAVLLFDNRRKRTLLVKWNPYLITVFLTVPLLLSQSRLATGYIGVTVLYSMIMPAVRKGDILVLFKKFIPLLGLGAVVIFLFYKYFWAGAYDLDQQFDPDYATNYFMQSASTTTTQYSGITQTPMGRAFAVTEAFRLIKSNSVNLFIGYGSGATTESISIGSQGKYFYKIGPLVGLGGNDLSRLVMEFGILGILAYFIFFLLLGRYRSMSKSTAIELKSLHTHIVLVLVLLSWYTVTLSSFFFTVVVGSFVALTQAEMDRYREHTLTGSTDAKGA